MAQATAQFEPGIATFIFYEDLVSRHEASHTGDPEADFAEWVAAWMIRGEFPKSWGELKRLAALKFVESRRESPPPPNLFKGSLETMKTGSELRRGESCEYKADLNLVFQTSKVHPNDISLWVLNAAEVSQGQYSGL